MTTRTRKSTFACRECGHTTPRWVGQCARCEAWNSVEEVAITATNQKTLRAGNSFTGVPKAVSLAELKSVSDVRLPSGISELDRVLGGGFISGSTVLLAGDPGIGKSTLLLQCAAGVAAKTGKPVIYATGEESQSQVASRAERLGISDQNLLIVETGDVLALGDLLETVTPALLVTDSIQTAWHSGIDGSPGTLGQVRQAAAALGDVARRSNTPVVMTGHVTKDGSVAGPKVLEHMVDVVLQLEGATGTSLRLLRGSKNRHGATDELGVFAMTGSGLEVVVEPSAIFLSQRNTESSGSAVATVIEGSRPLTVEVQALVTPTASTSPRRTANGYDLARLHLLNAVISKRLSLPLGTQDVVVNIAGGLRVSEPAADLAVALAIVSSYLDVPVRSGWSAAGEIGLGGELRAVHQPGRRVAEIRRLGLETCLIAAGCGDLAEHEGSVVRCVSLGEAVAAAIPMPPTAQMATDEHNSNTGTAVQMAQ